MECLELADLLLQGLLLLLGWGMAVEEEDDEGGGTRVEAEAGMLVEELKVTADEGACSVITKDCEVMPSKESAPKKRHFIKQWSKRKNNQTSGLSRREKTNPQDETFLTPHIVTLYGPGGGLC